MHSSVSVHTHKELSMSEVFLLQGLDPASRKNLWKVVQSAKTDKAVILTTHSMQEAEVLCDRLGIFVDGRMVILGNPKQLISRHGGYKVEYLVALIGLCRLIPVLVKQLHQVSCDLCILDNLSTYC